MMTIKRALMLGMLLALAACSRGEGLPGQKVGKPYMVGMKMYFPNADENYDEIGLASWYGPGFHGKYTASGEVFNQNAITAAHPTLPMPSMVRVTNLQNGRSLLVRINDRGPFAGGRIIDLSKESARQLGIHGKGLARVRVQYLAQETQEYLVAHNIKPASVLPKSPRQMRRIEREEIPPVEIAENDGGEAPVPSVTVVDVPEFIPSKPKPALQVIRNAQADETETLPKIDTSSEAQQVNELLNEGQQEGHIVQAGSFASEANAKSLASRLEPLGEVSILPLVTDEHTLYRVRVGPLQGSAEEALRQVRAAGASGATLVKN